MSAMFVKNDLNTFTAFPFSADVFAVHMNYVDKSS